MKKILITASVFTSVLLISLNVSAQYKVKNISQNSIISNLSLKKNEYVANEVIVKFRKNTNEQTIVNMAHSMGHRLDLNISKSQYQTIKFTNVEKIEDIIATYNSDPNVLYAQPNYVYKISAVTPPPTDIHYSKQWALNNSITPSNDIDAEKAWSINSDCSQNNIIVAVLDTGVNYLHQDLVNNMWVNVAEVNGVPNVDDDGNGKIDDFNGWDFIENDNSPLDTNGHGTHLAGTIAAEPNNANIGTVGVCWKASLMALRIGDAAGNGLTEARIVAGIEYAIKNGAKIINMSFGGSSRSKANQDMITEARNKGVILTIAAGNDTTDNDALATPSYPCNYKFASTAGVENPNDTLDNIICVASVDRDYNISTFSNFGITTVDIGAPGTDIISDWPITTTEIFNQGALAQTPIPFSGWSYDPANMPWKISNQVFQTQTGPITLTLLSDPSGFGINYGTNANSTLYQVINFPVADALKVITAEFIDLPFSPDGDFVFNVYDVGNVIPTTKTSINKKSGLAIFETEIPKICSNNTCSVGVNLLADGNGSVGKGIDVVGILIEASKFNNNVYNTISGTSMAAPHVAGLVALVSSYNPDYDYKDVIKAVLNGGDSISALAGKTVTGKTINAFGSLTYITKPMGLTGSFVKN
ncbi:MAG: S8 family serine peptidase [Thiohalomonadales bacterium]